MSVLNFESIYTGGLNQTPDMGKFKISAVGMGFKSLSTSQIITISQSEVVRLHFLRVARGFQFAIHTKSKQVLKFDGFEREDYDSINSFCKTNYSKTVEFREVSKRGYNWGSVEFEESFLDFKVGGKEAFEIPLMDVSNVATAGKNEVFLEFQQAKRDRNGPDALVEVRFFIPGNITQGQITSDGAQTYMKDKSQILADMQEDDDQEQGEISAVSQKVAVDENGEPLNAAAIFCETIKQKSKDNVSATELVASFDELLLLTPRGRFQVDIHPESFRLRGKSHDYKILYSSISKIFLVPKPDDMHWNLVLNINPPIRQGQTRYPFLVLQFEKEDEIELQLNMNDELLAERELEKTQDGPLYQITTGIFSKLSGKQIREPAKSYSSAQGYLGIKCSIKAAEAILYPMDKSFLAVTKMPILLPFVQIAMITFSRVTQSSSTTRTFEIKFSMTGGQEYVFSSIPREEHEPLESFCKQKKLLVRNEIGDDGVQGEKIDYREELGSESEDEDFVANSDQSDVNEEYNEDYSSSSDKDQKSGDENSENEDNDQGSKATPTETRAYPNKMKEEKPKSRKRQDDDGPSKKKTKKEKKPGPKRALTSFLYFCQDKRAGVRESDPGLSLGEVGKALGALWKEASKEEKEKYEALAAQDKERYNRELEEFKRTGVLPDGSKPSANSAKPAKEKVKKEKEVVKSEEFVEEDDEDEGDDF